MTTGAAAGAGCVAATVAATRPPKNFAPNTIPKMKAATTKAPTAATGIGALRKKPELVPAVVAAKPEGAGICSAGIGPLPVDGVRAP